MISRQTKLILLGAMVSLYCIARISDARAEHIKTFVSIVPQKFFVEKIGGDLVDVSVMVLPGNSPATYEPKPKQMANLTDAKAYFAIEVPFENSWLKKIAAANPKMLIVHIEKGLEKIPMKARHHEQVKHKQKAEHHHIIKDPHLWTSPPQVMLMARNILMGLLAVDPDNSPIYEANYKKFIMEIVDLDAELTEIFTGKRGLQFMVFHPAWGYFADAYGLEQVPIEMEGKDPKPAQLRELIDHAKERGVKVIFVQPQFSTKGAEIIAKAIGGEVVLADPLDPDWANNLRQQAARFKAALR